MSDKTNSNYIPEDAKFNLAFGWLAAAAASIAAWAGLA